MSSNVTANFTRLKDGSWGVRVNTEARPESGDIIIINKRDGSNVVATIAEVQWFGTARDGRSAALVSIVKESRRASYRRSRLPCGYPGCDGVSFCDECSD